MLTSHVHISCAVNNSKPPPNTHQPLRRTTSIAQPPAPLPLRIQNSEQTVTDWLQMHPAVQGSVPAILSHDRRSPSLTEHAPLSPQSSVTSSGSGGSDCPHDDGPQPIRDSFMEEGSGMRGNQMIILQY